MENRRDISIHDNFLVSYEVRCERREIRLHTEYRDGGLPYEFTDIEFTGVACYDFEHDSEVGTIIFDLEEVSASDIYRDQAEKILAGLRYGWPGSWAQSLESAIVYFEQNGIRGFELCASCGMTGWILARTMKMVLLDGPFRPDDPPEAAGTR